MIRKIVFFLSLSIGISMPISAQIQNLNLDQLSYINVDQLSDEQIQSFWEKAQAQGYSITDLETAARVKGVPVSQITKLRQRIMSLSTSVKKKTTTTTTSTDSGDANNSSTEESKDGTEAEKQTASTSSTTVTKTVTKQGSQLSIWELLLYGVLYFGGMVAVFWILAWILKKVLDV